MFDDDNDLDMAKQCRWCLLPSLTSPSVRAALGNNPHWILSESCGSGVFACEEALERIYHNNLESGTLVKPLEKSNALTGADMSIADRIKDEEFTTEEARMPRAPPGCFDYSRFDNLEVSEDERDAAGVCLCHGV